MIHLASANDILDAFLGSESPSEYELALTSNRPMFDTGVGSLVEPSAADYARVVVSNNSAMFPNAVNGTKTNGSTIVFPPAVEDWGTIRYWALIDPSSGGSIRFSGRYSSRFIAEGATVRFLTGAMTFRIR